MTGPARLFVRTLLLSGALALPSTAIAQNSAPVVANVVAQQIAGTGNVRITFDVSDADGDQVTARLICSSNNGTTFDLLPVTVSGDVNRAIAPGTGKQIVWNAAVDYPGRYWTQVVARVYASDGVAFAGEMVSVPAGSFNMGSPSGSQSNQPVHSVLLDGFSIDKYEVTNAEFQQFIDAGGYSTQAFWSAAGWSWRLQYNRTQPVYWGYDDPRCGPAWPSFPVVTSWYEAEAYANFVGKRLPTEAEWEKAARGSAGRDYPWEGAYDSRRVNAFGSNDPYEPGSTPVGFYDGRLHPNPPFQTIDSAGPFGTYDQAGNVLEWVSDWFDAGYYEISPAANPAGPITGSSKVMRGGGWHYEGGQNWHVLESYHRNAIPPAYEGRVIGFRCARSGT
jgi:formylglycine-generating enzyme required for sulfatase activity